jgi:hypothetical protein
MNPQPSLTAPPVAPSAHVTITPSILYFGTPVVLLSTEKADATFNLAPMSSAWALDQPDGLAVFGEALGQAGISIEGGGLFSLVLRSRPPTDPPDKRPSRRRGGDKGMGPGTERSLKRVRRRSPWP